MKMVFIFTSLALIEVIKRLYSVNALCIHGVYIPLSLMLMPLLWKCVQYFFLNACYVNSFTSLILACVSKRHCSVILLNAHGASLTTYVPI